MKALWKSLVQRRRRKRAQVRLQSHVGGKIWTCKEKFLLHQDIDVLDKFIATQMTMCRYLLISSGAALATIVAALSQSGIKRDFLLSLLTGAPFFVWALCLAALSATLYSASLARLVFLKFRFQLDGYTSTIYSRWKTIGRISSFALWMMSFGGFFLVSGFFKTLAGFRIAIGMTPFVWFPTLFLSQ